MSASDLPSPPTRLKASTQGNLLGVLTAVFYVLFTLVPDSHSLMVSWAWVFLWQVGLFCPLLWLLGMLWQGRSRWLGNGLDWLAGLLVLVLLLSSSAAEFPFQARWYSWAAACFVAALYAVRSWAIFPQRRSWLLQAQGYLSLVFILLSLGLWATQTWLPELARLRDLQPYGVTLPFTFAEIGLRNWAPLGHQNYVAGYLVLALPLLVSLGIVASGKQRLVWWAGAGLGLVDLYTTNSRAGWLALLVSAIAGVVLSRKRLPRRALLGALFSGVCVLAIVLLTNRRLWTTAARLFNPTQATGEVAYRLITTMTGWQMGLSRWFKGTAPGSVPLLYQQFRPDWAGREAEWTYQLHSTPAQLWAELGMGSVLIGIGAIVLLGWLGFRRMMRSEPLPLPIASLFVGLLSYGVVSLTDYQLDNVAISGTIVVFLAVLAAELSHRSTVLPDVTEDVETLLPQGNGSKKLLEVSLVLQPLLAKWFNARSQRIFAALGLGIAATVAIWLIPIHHAWMLSSQGFAALAQQDLAGLVPLRTAQRLTPWEPYYAYQLGWHLGDRSLRSEEAGPKQSLLKEGIVELQQGVKASPYQEFGHTNLAWLLFNRNPAEATQHFGRSAALIPAKRGVFLGLGLSLLAQQQTELGITALALEAVRDPLLLTSPIWKTPELRSPETQMSQQVERLLTRLIDTAPDSSLRRQLHQIRGFGRWWRGDFAAAQADWGSDGTPLSQAVLDLALGKSMTVSASLANTAGGRTIAAWQNPSQRQELLQQAWILATRQSPPADMVRQLVESMNQSVSFDQWLKQNAPSQAYRRERTGFGVNSRHVDGPAPLDYLTVVDNVPMTQLLKDLLPSLTFAPDLDAALRGDRAALMNQIQPSASKANG